MGEFRTGPLNLLKKEADLNAAALGEASDKISDEANVRWVADDAATKRAEKEAGNLRKWQESDFEAVRRLLDRVSTDFNPQELKNSLEDTKAKLADAVKQLDVAKADLAVAKADIADLKLKVKP